MIVNIRKYMHHKGVKVVLWLTLFSIVGGMGLFSAIFMNKKVKNSVATVNGREISLMEFRRHYGSLMQFIKQLQAQYGDQADLILSFYGLSKERNPKQITLDNLVQQNLILDASEKIGAKISQNYIKDKLKDQYFVSQRISDLVPVQVFQNGVLDPNLLSMYLERQGISHDEFEVLINQALQRNLFSQILRGSVYVNNNSIKEEYVKQYAKKKYGILSLPISKYLSKAKEQKFEESDFKAFYEKHKDVYKVAAKRTGKVWTFAIDDFGINISDKDLESYYNKNRLEFLKSPSGREIKRIIIKMTPELNAELANKKIQEIAKELKTNPELFDKYAQKESIKLFRAKGNVDMLLENAAFNLTKNGELSDVIKTKDGFEIIKLINKKDPEYKDLASVKEDIKKKLKTERFDQEFGSNAQRVLLQSKDTPDIFVNFITNKKAKESLVGPVEKKSGDLLNKKLFDLADKGDRGFYIDENNNKGYIVQLVLVEQAFVPEFAKIKDKVLEDFYKQKAIDNLKADLDKIIKNTGSLEVLAKEYQAKYMVTDWVDPKESNSIKVFEDKGISFEEVSRLYIVGSKTEEISESEGYVIELKEVDKLDQKDFEAKKSNVSRKLNNALVSNISQDLINYLQKNAKILIDQTNLERASGRI